MSNVKVIGITGKARAGKDTVARILQAELVSNTNPDLQDYVVAIESWAAPIKSMVAMLLDFFSIGSIMEPSQLAPYIDGDKKEEVIDAIGASPRQMMQTLGTDWGRDLISKSLWIDCMQARVNMYGEAVNHGHNGAFVIIPDCRFDNEAEFIRKAGGTVIEVTTARETQSVAEHASEAGISDDLIDITIANDGDLEELRAQCCTVLEESIIEKELNPEPVLDAPKEVTG